MVLSLVLLISVFIPTAIKFTKKDQVKLYEGIFTNERIVYFEDTNLMDRLKLIFNGEYVPEHLLGKVFMVLNIVQTLYM